MAADANTGRTPNEERLARNFAEFEHYLARAQTYLEQGELATAAAHCAIASHIATQNHAGIFWSPRAEKVLTTIGRMRETRTADTPAKTEFKRVLQVVTQVSAVGG